ncbi:MAG TPA: hypothetical protein VFA36_10875, partial [Burkholderiales bacterium]|nr:hypothetical protein [Burkholderiales bacterium]
LPGNSGTAAFSPDSARSYTYDSGGKLRTFDLTAATVAGQFQEIGSPGTALVGSPGTDTLSFGTPSAVVRLIATPDGGTLFLAGGSQVVIQPAP